MQLYSTTELVRKNDGEYNTDPCDILRRGTLAEPRQYYRLFSLRFFVVSLRPCLFTVHVHLSRRLSQLLISLKVNEPVILIFR
jgi:hypothetical protein